MATSPKVAVLMGGVASEHDISLSSGRQVAQSLDGRPVMEVVIARDGSWSFDGERMPSLGAALDRLKREADVAFIALHGRGGEDGVIQGLLQSAGVPHTGSGVMGSALAMDKIRTKLVYRSVGLPTPDFFAVYADEWKRSRRDVLAQIASEVPGPWVVKRACEGSSYGIAFPKDASKLEEDIEELIAAQEILLVERKIQPGREMTCGVLYDGKTEQLEALPVTEIVPGEKYEYFDLEAKYTPGATDEITPARISDELTAEIQRLAVSAHRWLGLWDFSRTDVFVDGAGQPYLIETNTIPGLTPTSLLPQAAQVAGYSFGELVTVLIDNALARAR